jgi:hypothetical protein
MYTGDAVFVHICCQLPLEIPGLQRTGTDFVLLDLTGTNVDVPPEMVPHLTSEEIATLTYGSQVQLAAWYTYTALICMLILSKSLWKFF